MDSQVPASTGYCLGSGSNSDFDLVERGSATCKTWELGIKSGARRKKKRTSAACPNHEERQRRRKCVQVSVSE